MKLDELTGTLKIFDTFSSLPTYESVLGGLDPETTDNYISLMYGERECNGKLTADNFENFLFSIWSVNNDSWGKIWAAYKKEYDLLSGEMERTATGATNTTKENGGYTLDREKATYDNGDLLADGKDSQTTSNAREDITTSTITRYGNYGLTPQKIIETEIRLRKNNAIETIVKSVINNICLDIY